MLFSHSGFYCVVAESGGQILGSNCLDQRSPAQTAFFPIVLDSMTVNSQR